MDDILGEIDRGRLFQIIEELVLWETASRPMPRPMMSRSEASVVGRLWAGCVFVFRNLYRLKEWGMTIRLVGQPPIGGTR